MFASPGILARGLTKEPLYGFSDPARARSRRRGGFDRVLPAVDEIVRQDQAYETPVGASNRIQGYWRR